MPNTYIEYQNNLKKHSFQMYALVLWFFLLAIFLMLVIVCLLAVFPVGVALVVGCVFYTRFVVKKCKRCGDTWREIKNYRAAHDESCNISGNITYCFVMPFATMKAIDIISRSLAMVGEIKTIDSIHGRLTGVLYTSSTKKRPITFYVEKNETQCKVRACFHRIANDDWWDLFLSAMFETSPCVNFGVELANGNPVIAAVLDLQSGTEQVILSATSGGASLARFLVGGALFGGAGAVVGGLSGTQRTVSNAKTVYSNEVLVRVIYSNGRLWEGTVSKGTPLYNEIVVNMK